MDKYFLRFLINVNVFFTPKSNITKLYTSNFKPCSCTFYYKLLFFIVFKIYLLLSYNNLAPIAIKQHIKINKM